MFQTAPHEQEADAPKTVRSNRRIDTLITSALWHIDQRWGAEQLDRYLTDLDLIESGASFADIGYAERRLNTMPALISAGPQRKVVEGCSVNLYDPAEVMPGSFALIRLSGVMRADDGASSRGITSMVRDLRAAYQNDNIAGILIEANTGGGESTAGEMLYSILNESPKAVVTWFHKLASAGIQATLPSDEIIASNPSAEAGSIGTFMTMSRGFANFYNSNYEDIYASKSTNKNREFRELLKGNKAPLMEMVDKSNELFLSKVQAHRPLRGNIDYTLSGAMFTAQQAKSRGLIDGIGSWSYAIRRLEANVAQRNKS